MSRCISSAGEYSDHVLMVGEAEARFICQRCGVLDEDRLIAALGVAEAALARVKELHSQGERPSSEHFYCDPDDCDRAGEGHLEPVCRTCYERLPCPTVAALVPTPEPPAREVFVAPVPDEDVCPRCHNDPMVGCSAPHVIGSAPVSEQPKEQR